VAPVLGSRATDTLSGLGPPVLRTGDVLPVGPPGGAPAPVWFSPRPAVAAGPVRLRVRLGPRDDWFTRSALTTFTTATYAVSPLSDRIGARLTGPPLARTSTGELPSEGIVLGAVQVPPDGQPLVFLANHPTTGGYPVIAVVDEPDLPLLAQARPGTTVTFSRQE
jgi:allophanate hydrolase subunit 2